MGLLSTVADIIRDLLIFVVAMTALLIVLIVVVSRMPDDNPLKRILSALSYRIGATAAAGAVAIPIEPIPGLDGLYDIAVPIVLIWYWYTSRFPGCHSRQIACTAAAGAATASTAITRAAIAAAAEADRTRLMHLRKAEPEHG